MVARNTDEEQILELQKSKREPSKAILTENNGLLRKLTAEDPELPLS